jgi:hypothetical protein
MRGWQGCATFSGEGTRCQAALGFLNEVGRAPVLGKLWLPPAWEWREQWPIGGQTGDGPVQAPGGRPLELVPGSAPFSRVLWEPLLEAHGISSGPSSSCALEGE